MRKAMKQLLFLFLITFSTYANCEEAIIKLASFAADDFTVTVHRNKAHKISSVVKKHNEKTSELSDELISFLNTIQEVQDNPTDTTNSLRKAVGDISAAAIGMHEEGRIVTEFEIQVANFVKYFNFPSSNYAVSDDPEMREMYNEYLYHALKYFGEFILGPEVYTNYRESLAAEKLIPYREVLVDAVRNHPKYLFDPASSK